MDISGLDAGGQGSPDASQMGVGRSHLADPFLAPANSSDDLGASPQRAGMAADFPDQEPALQGWLSPKSMAGDRLTGSRQDDVIKGEAGDEVLLGRRGHDRLVGKAGDDRLLGRDGKDQLLGGRGRDRLSGGEGADQLTGGPGRDRLTGGGGRDQFILQTKQGGQSLRQADVITDFRDGVDRFRLEDIEFSNLDIVQGSGRRSEHVLIRDRTTGGILAMVKGTTSRQITAEDMVGLDAVENSPTTDTPPTGDGSNTDDGTAGPETPTNPDRLPPSPNGDGVNPELPGDGSTTGDSPTSKNPVDNPSDGNPLDENPPDENPPDASPVVNPPVADNPVDTAPPPVSLPGAIASVGEGLNFNEVNLSSEAAVRAIGSPTLTVGDRTIYIGYRQVSSNNQNPIVVSFNSSDPSQNWTVTDYEVTGADSRGYGLFWSGSDLYGIFSIDGAQGNSTEDFRRASGDVTQSWLRSYGSGGGAKIAVIARIDLATGQLLDAAHLSALLSNGRSNSLVIDDVGVDASGNLVIRAQSYFSPRRPNGQAMTQVSSDGSPFDYTVEITPDLKRVVSTAAVGWT